MGCPTPTVKFFVFLFNFIFAVVGLVFLVVGILYKVDLDSYTISIKKEGLSLTPSLLIPIGVIMFINSFFGCCGAIRESSGMLTAYAVILLMIVILQVALGVFAFLRFKDEQQEIRETISKQLRSALEQYNTDKIVEESFSSLQYGLRCCGIDGPQDYRRIWTNNRVPSSCCYKVPKNCYESSAYHQGCSAALWEFLKKSVKVIGYIAVFFGAIELVGAIVALYLAHSIRKYYLPDYA